MWQMFLGLARLYHLNFLYFSLNTQPEKQILNKIYYCCRHYILLLRLDMHSGLKGHSKVHIFWEGHKILRNLHQSFVLCTYCLSNNWWIFRKTLWPSQNIWTLTDLWLIYCYCYYYSTLNHFYASNTASISKWVDRCHSTTALWRSNLSPKLKIFYKIQYTYGEDLRSFTSKTKKSVQQSSFQKFWNPFFKEEAIWYVW